MSSRSIQLRVAYVITPIVGAPLQVVCVASMTPPAASYASGEAISILNPANGAVEQCVDLQEGGSQPSSVVISGSKKQFACSQCDKMFTTTGHLSRHVKTHSGDRPYVCPYPGCDKKTGRYDNLVQHFRIHLPKPDRKRGASYVRDVIQLMETTDCPGTTVLQIAGLLPMGPTTSAGSATQTVSETVVVEEERVGEEEDAQPSEHMEASIVFPTRLHVSVPRHSETFEVAPDRSNDVIKAEPHAEPPFPLVDPALAYHETRLVSAHATSSEPVARFPREVAPNGNVTPWHAVYQQSFVRMKVDRSNSSGAGPLDG